MLLEEMENHAAMLTSRLGPFFPPLVYIESPCGRKKESGSGTYTKGRLCGSWACISEAHRACISEAHRAVLLLGFSNGNGPAGG